MAGRLLTVRGLEDEGSNPGPPTSFEFNIGDFVFEARSRGRQTYYRVTHTDVIALVRPCHLLASPSTSAGSPPGTAWFNSRLITVRRPCVRGPRLSRV
jgi:hypothetical protein